MKIEFETKFFANHNMIRIKLEALGAQIVRERCLMRRYVFFVSSSVQGVERWIRVRDEGAYSTLSLKLFDGFESIDSVQELEVHVSDFDAMVIILQQIGYVSDCYVENYREIWQLHDVEIMLDEWPWLDPFVEIEGLSQAKVFNLVACLGIDVKDLHYGPNRLLYEKKYGVSSEVIKKNKQLTFQLKPNWLN